MSSLLDPKHQVVEKEIHPPTLDQVSYSFRLYPGVVPSEYMVMVQTALPSSEFGSSKKSKKSKRSSNEGENGEKRKKKKDKKKKKEKDKEKEKVLNLILKVFFKKKLFYLFRNHLEFQTNRHNCIFVNIYLY